MVSANTGYICGEFCTLLKTTNAGLTFIYQELNIIPTEYNLYQNYPNPFNSSTIIEYELGKNSFVELKIYDVNGKEINTIVNENQSTGSYKVLYDASEMPSGVYFYSLSINSDKINTKKFLLLK